MLGNLPIVRQGTTGGTGTIVREHGILGRADIGTDDKLLRIVCEDLVGELVSMTMGNAKPSTKGFCLGARLVIETSCQK